MRASRGRREELYVLRCMCTLCERLTTGLSSVRHSRGPTPRSVELHRENRAQFPLNQLKCESKAEFFSGALLVLPSATALGEKINLQEEKVRSRDSDLFL